MLLRRSKASTGAKASSRKSTTPQAGSRLGQEKQLFICLILLPLEESSSSSNHKLDGSRDRAFIALASHSTFLTCIATSSF